MLIRLCPQASAKPRLGLAMILMTSRQEQKRTTGVAWPIRQPSGNTMVIPAFIAIGANA